MSGGRSRSHQHLTIPKHNETGHMHDQASSLPSTSPALSPALDVTPPALNKVHEFLDPRKCKRKNRRKARPRTTINPQEYVSGETSSPEDAHEDEPAAKQPKGWKTISAVTLGDGPRDLILQLAGECGRIDIVNIVNTLIAVESPVHMTPTVPGSTLKELTSQWTTYSGDKHIVQFWQAVIEITVAIRCQRYVLKGSREDY